MVETVDISPRLDAVASFAAKPGPVGALTSHLLVELALMRILVASGTRAILKVEGKDFVGATG